ncbi:MAG: putative lipid II flippase FtsW [Actinomycetota bacterium]|nr:putative lipid II flippase FtsW [Actinomycetota bacterium]
MVRQLDRPLTSYYLLLGATTALLVLGLVMVFSASSVKSYAEHNDSFYFFKRQLVWAGLGLPVLWTASRLPPRAWRALAYVGLIGVTVLLCLVVVSGKAVNGNRNWVAVGGFQIQPSEFAKIVIVLWAADMLARKQRLLDQWKHLLVPLLPVSCVLIGLVLLGNDLGTALILMAIVAGLLFFAGAPLRLFALLGGLSAGLVVVLSNTAAGAHRLERFRGWWDPEAVDPLRTGWQLQHSKYALASGNWWGLGLGASREKWGGLPEQHTDFIFAIIGEELGLIGTLAVLALFGALGYAGIRVATRTGDPFVRLAAAGVTSWLLVQALVNIGAVTGLLPITGVPLPLVSYGGSALVPTMAALGMLLSFARREPGAAEALRHGPGPVRRTLRALVPSAQGAR